MYVPVGRTRRSKYDHSNYNTLTCRCCTLYREHHKGPSSASEYWHLFCDDISHLGYNIKVVTRRDGMPTPHAAKYVKCPYYHNLDPNRIVCEGLYEGNTINLVFELPEERKRYMNEYCNSIFGCRDCFIHMMLNQKYEEDIYG